MAQEEIIFKISADAGQAEKETKSLEDSLEAVNDAAEEVLKTNTDLSASFEDIYGDLKPLSARIGEMEDRMYELALAGQQNTEEFKELQSETARYRQVIISTDKAVDQLAEQGRGLGAALQVGTAVTAGYGAIQGSMVALGIESESLEKSFVKLQAVQTVLASLEQLKLSLDKQSIVVTKAKAIATGVMTGVQTAWTTATAGTTAAMGALKIAMLAIPLVAILAGIVALVSALSSLADSTEMLEEENQKLNDSFDKLTESFERYDRKVKRSIENRIKLAKAQGKSIEEIQELELEQLEISEKSRKKEIEITVASIKAKRKILAAAYKLEDEEMINKFKGEIKESRKRYKELKQLDGQYYVDREVMILEHEKVIREQEDKAQDERESKYKAAQEKRKRAEEEARRKQLEREKLYTDLTLQNIEDEEIRKLSILNESHRRQREQLIEKYGQDEMLIQQLEIKQGEEMLKLTKEIENNRQLEKDKARKKEREEAAKQAELVRKDEKARLEGELIQMRDDFEATQALKRELAELEMNQALANEDLTQGEIFKIKEQYSQKVAELDKAESDRRKQMEAETAQAIKNVYESSFSAISNLSEGIFAMRIANAEAGSKKELELQKKAFEANKKFQIVQATLAGIQAVQNAFTTAAASPFTTIFPAYPYIQAAAAGANALGNILKIKSTSFQGGGSVGSTSVSAPSVSVPEQPETDEDVTTLTAGLEGSGVPNQQTTVGIVDSEIKLALDNTQKVEVISTVG